MPGGAWGDGGEDRRGPVRPRGRKGTNGVCIGGRGNFWVVLLCSRFVGVVWSGWMGSEGSSMKGGILGGKREFCWYSGRLCWVLLLLLLICVFFPAPSLTGVFLFSVLRDFPLCLLGAWVERNMGSFSVSVLIAKLGDSHFGLRIPGRVLAISCELIRADDSPNVLQHDLRVQLIPRIDLGLLRRFIAENGQRPHVIERGNSRRYHPGATEDGQQNRADAQGEHIEVIPGPFFQLVISGIH
mmetsp:Transcript_911/g.1959  ORF Transcript_911/g.1959 Transcript_911/m.1959 type:complete len:241 (+) Transcript_911:1308-2030(+)